MSSLTYWQRVKLGYSWGRGLGGYVGFVAYGWEEFVDSLYMVRNGCWLALRGAFWLSIAFFRMSFSPILFLIQPLAIAYLYRNEKRVWERIQEIIEEEEKPE